MSRQGILQASMVGPLARQVGRRLPPPVRVFHVPAMHSVLPRIRPLLLALTGVLTLASFSPRAVADLPDGLVDALTTHTWSFPQAKPPIYFHADGNVIDGDYHLRFNWTLDTSAGVVHLVEYKWKAKEEDKAKIDLRFAPDLTSFTWSDSRTHATGTGTRLDELPGLKTPPIAAAQEPPKAPLTFDPRTAPSAQLQAFATAWLDKLTGPLDNAPLPHAQIIQLQTDYQALLGVATPAQKPAYQAALQACVIFGNLMDAREKARTALTNAQANSSGEIGTARKGARSAANAQNDSKFVAAGAANAAIGHWQEQQKPWRDAIQQVLAREKQAELTANNSPTIPAPHP